MKILYLVTKADIGGAQKYVNDLSENLNKGKFETLILAGGRRGARLLSNTFMPYFLFINDWLALMELIFTFKRIKPDVVHLNSSKAGVIGSIAAKLAGVPKVIFTAHGWVFNPDNDLSLPRRQFYIFLHKIAARFQDKIINVSEYDRRLAIKYKIAPENKLVTIYNGLDCQKLKFLDKKNARRALLTQVANHDLPITDTWIGSVGRLVTEKSYGDFIQTAALINENLRFFIIGSGYQKNKLQSLIKKLGLENRFFIVENLAPAAPYLKAFDVFLLSSIKEGMPYTLLEAMAAKLPIVVTRVGGMTEIIDPLNENKRGLVMPPEQPEELARAINYLLRNKSQAEKLSEEAEKTVRDKLTLEKMLVETEKAYLS